MDNDDVDCHVDISSQLRQFIHIYMTNIPKSRDASSKITNTNVSQSHNDVIESDDLQKVKRQIPIRMLIRII